MSPSPRAVIYARYSSETQRLASTGVALSTLLKKTGARPCFCNTRGDK